jgi:hypothetical protein
MPVIPLTLGLSFIVTQSSADLLVPRLSGNDRSTCGLFQAVDPALGADEEAKDIAAERIFVTGDTVFVGPPWFGFFSWG